MIQRIQSVYLLLGALAMAALFLFGGGWQGAISTVSSWLMPVLYLLGGLIGLSAIAAIFLYSNRSRQRTVVFGIQVLTIIFALLFYGGLYAVDGLNLGQDGNISAGYIVMLLLPAVIYLLFYLARRGITRDIELIRSMDRLR